MITLDEVNKALDGRNESDVPLNDVYWKVVNMHRQQQSMLPIVESIVVVEPIVVEPIIVEPIVEPVNKELEDFLSNLNG